MGLISSLMSSNSASRRNPLNDHVARQDLIEFPRHEQPAPQQISPGKGTASSSIPADFGLVPNAATKRPAYHP